MIQFIVDLFFFGLPLFSLVMFIVSLCRFISAKVENHRFPYTFTKAEIRSRLFWLILFSVMFIFFAVVVIGIISILQQPAAYM